MYILNHRHAVKMAMKERLKSLSVSIAMICSTTSWRYKANELINLKRCIFI